VKFEIVDEPRMVVLIEVLAIEGVRC